MTEREKEIESEGVGKTIWVKDLERDSASKTWEGGTKRYEKSTRN
jgi:hypothetical protein